MTITRKYLRFKLVMCIFTVGLYYVMENNLMSESKLKIVGLIQMILMEIPTAISIISYSTLFRRNSSDAIGGTFVSIFDSIFWLGMQLPNTIVLMLNYYVNTYILMLISFMFSLFFYFYILRHMITIESTVKDKWRIQIDKKEPAI